jgi:hypothetical protein
MFLMPTVPSIADVSSDAQQSTVARTASASRKRKGSSSAAVPTAKRPTKSNRRRDPAEQRSGESNTEQGEEGPHESNTELSEEGPHESNTELSEEGPCESSAEQGEEGPQESNTEGLEGLYDFQVCCLVSIGSVLTGDGSANDVSWQRTFVKWSQRALVADARRRSKGAA